VAGRGKAASGENYVDGKRVIRRNSMRRTLICLCFSGDMPQTMLFSAWGSRPERAEAQPMSENIGIAPKATQAIFLYASFDLCPAREWLAALIGYLLVKRTSRKSQVLDCTRTVIRVMFGIAVRNTLLDDLPPVCRLLLKNPAGHGNRPDCPFNQRQDLSRRRACSSFRLRYRRCWRS